MQYTAQDLYKVTAEHRKSLDVYLDTVFKALHDAACQGLDHYSVPFNIIEDPSAFDVIAALQKLGYKVDISGTVSSWAGPHASAPATKVHFLNVGWGPGYVCGGDAPLVN